MDNFIRFSFKNITDCVSSQTKLQEVNNFTGVSAHNVIHGVKILTTFASISTSSLEGDPMTCIGGHLSGRYTSYWNAFLLANVVCMSNHVQLCFL